MIQHNTLQENYQLIEVSGHDAATFLQKQLTCDINKISNKPSLGSICNIQGRVECIFKIYKIHNNFYLHIIKELLEKTIYNLHKYILRAKVTIQAIETKINNIHNQTDNILFEAAQISQKIPEIYLTTTEKFLPNNINLIQLGAVSLNKGCYKGQAIINRIHCLGKTKKELKVVSIHATDSHHEDILIPGNKLNNPDITIVRSVVINNNHQLVLVEAPVI